MKAPPPAETAAIASGPVRPARPDSADRALAIVCIGAIAVLLAGLLMYGYGRDQGIYAMVGRVMLEGGMPYRDAWDFKPPGVFVVYAATRALLGPEQASIRFVEALGLAATVLVMVHLARRLFDDARAGLVGGALAIAVHAQLDFWHTAQPESFGGMLTIFALALGTRVSASRRSQLAAWALAGALFGAAGLLKPPLAGGGAVLAAAIAWPAYRASGRARDGVAPVLAIGVGGALPIALCLAWFAARGAYADLHETLFVFTPHYTALGWEGESLVGMAWHGVSEWLFKYSALTTAGVLLLAVLGPRPRERAGVWLLAGIVAMHIAGVTMQGKFFPYHYGATWPVTGLLAALGLLRVWDHAKARGRAGLAAFVAAMLVLAVTQTATKHVADGAMVRMERRFAIARRAVTGEGGEAQAALDRRALDELASVADVNAGANRAVADYLREHVPASRPVLVWGFEPVIYDLADRAVSTRYLYDVPQRVAWAAPPMRARMMDDLRDRPPAAIVVERRDVFPMVTGDAIDSADTIEGFPAFRDLLAARYELAATIEDFDLYLERDEGAAEAP